MPHSSLVSAFASRVDYHQLPSYARVMERIHWDIVPVSGSYMFVKRLGPISFAKLQRPTNIDIPLLATLQKKLRIAQLFIEPHLSCQINGKPVNEAGMRRALIGAGFKSTLNHHAYTKTLIIDISDAEAKIISSFSQTARYRIRKALKSDVSYQKIPFSKLTKANREEILELHKTWAKEKHVLGYTDQFLQAFWDEMKQEGMMILAYRGKTLYGAMFLLVHHHVGMYFYQFTSREARDIFCVPYGLAFYAIRVARELGADLFDFCSAYDERYGSEHVAWKGFTRHKELYHPESIYYPGAFVRQFPLGF